MKLKEILTQLQHGELKQVHIAKDDEGNVAESEYPGLLSHINLGLTELFKRFPLKESRMMLRLVPGRILYSINSAHADSNTASSADKYLNDSDEKFTDTIHKIERVYTDTGFELSLNDLTDPLSLFTPSMTSLRLPAQFAVQSPSLPREYQTTHLELVYRANHPAIVMDLRLFDPERIEVELPHSHLQPLLYFIASRVHNPIGMVNEFNAGNNWAAKYEAACQQIENWNLRVDGIAQNDRLSRNGWV